MAAHHASQARLRPLAAERRHRGGGDLVQRNHRPPLGTEVAVTIAAPGGEPLALVGHVALIRLVQLPGFGVDFVPAVGDPGRRLRALLRHASETATVDLGSADD